MSKRVMTFLGWVLSSALLMIGTFALVQDNPPIALALVVILWGILCLPPLYELTQKLEPYGWTWNLVSRLGAALLIPAFLAPWISPKDLSFYERIQNPFVITKDSTPRSVTPQPTLTASSAASASPAPVTVSASPLPILKALELQKDQTYVVSEQTSLMASNSPTDIVADIQQMKLIPKGGVFKVLEKAVKTDKIWYQVAAFDQSRIPVGTGWINSTTLVEEVATATPTLVPSAVQSGLPSPEVASSLAAIIAKAQGLSSAPPSPSLDAPAVSAKPQISTSPNIAKTPQPSLAAGKPLISPSKVLPNLAVPPHRVSTEVMADGSRIVIETDDAMISRDQCKALVKTYLAKAGGKGQIVVYKPNPKPPWNGRVLAFCFDDLDNKGTVINGFYGW
jgi:hypothetical protein